MKTSTKDANLGAVATRVTRPSNDPTISVWFRLGLPAALAIAAGWLNATAVRQKLNPTEAFALTVQAAPGMRLKPEHLKPVQVGGSLDRTVLISKSDLQSGGQGRELSIVESLQASPKYLTRFLNAGELLTDGCLSSGETLSDDERLLQIQTSRIRGNCSTLKPGQIVYFDAIHRSSNGDKLNVQEIGPFRVAVTERSETEKSSETQYLGLVTKLGPLGQLSADAELLRTAAYAENSISLALIEKSSQSKPANRNGSNAVARKAD
ncbi:MAG: hypothetical protein SFV81_28730 [Pirellulaceae bacterium]|nr:hypothetical protein [Pirellulaceae bacterium]